MLKKLHKTESTVRGFEHTMRNRKSHEYRNKVQQTRQQGIEERINSKCTEQLENKKPVHICTAHHSAKIVHGLLLQNVHIM